MNKINLISIFFVLFLSVWFIVITHPSKNHLKELTSYQIENRTAELNTTFLNASLTIKVAMLDSVEQHPISWSAILKNKQNGNVIDTAYSSSDSIKWLNLPTEIENYQNIPQEFWLGQSYPNPFNPSVKIPFSIDKETQIKLEIYGLNGEHVKTLFEGNVKAGTYEATWNGDNDNANTAAAGIYFYRLKSDGRQLVGKMINLGGSGKSPFGVLKTNHLNYFEKEMSGEQGYIIDLRCNDDSTHPLFINQSAEVLNLTSDTTLFINLTRKFKPIKLTHILDVTINEDSQPDTIAIIDAQAFDKNGYPVAPDLFFTNSNPSLINIILEDKTLKATYLAPNGNGVATVVYGASNPRIPGQIAQDSFYVKVKPLADIVADLYSNGTPVTNAKVEAKNALGQVIRGVWTGSSNHAIFENLEEPVKQILVSKTDSSNVSFSPYTFNFISPFAGDTSLIANLVKDARLLSFNLTDMFLNTPVDNVYIKTSKEAGVNYPGRKYKAGLGEEKIIVNGPAHLRSGIKLGAGINDSTLNHFIVNADTSNKGLDSVMLQKLVTHVLSGGYRGNVSQSLDGQFASLTPTSIKDTVWIYGLIPPVSSQRFRTTGQLNEIAKVLNDTAKVMTSSKLFPDGLFGVNKRIIAIADSNFNKPDSVARFLYSNMKVVPQSIAPIDYETLKAYISIVAGTGTGGNGPYFESDGLTLKGGFITMGYSFSNSTINRLTKEELFSMLMGSVEIPAAQPYPSLYWENSGTLAPQDIRRQQFILDRFNEGGRKFPDLPKDF